MPELAHTHVELMRQGRALFVTRHASAWDRQYAMLRASRILDSHPSRERLRAFCLGIGASLLYVMLADDDGYRRIVEQEQPA